MSADVRARNAVVTRLRQCAPKLTAAGMADLVWDDALSLLCDTLNRVPALAQADVVALARDDLRSNLIVMLLRLIASAEMRGRADFFAPFVLDDAPSVDAYAARRVEPMGEEADHAHAVALADALGVPVRVEYVDLSPGGAATTIDFDPNPDAGGVAGGKGVADGSTAPPRRVTLLYRPGHYDILYETGDAAVAGMVAAG